MNSTTKTAVLWSASAALVIALVQPAAAQRGGAGARLFGAIPAPTLALLSEVQSALELTDAQKQTVGEVQNELNDLRREAFQSAQGDFDQMRLDIAKVYADMTTKLNASLEEAQQKRLHQVYLQVNGPVALADEWVANALELSDEQKNKLEEAAAASRQEVFASFGDFQGMSEEEQQKRVAELIESRDASLLGVLDDDQKKKFEELKGDALEVDLSALPGPGGR